MSTLDEMLNFRVCVSEPEQHMVMLKICAQTLELRPGPQFYDVTQNVFLGQLKVLEEQLNSSCPASQNNGHVRFYIHSQLPPPPVDSQTDY